MMKVVVVEGEWIKEEGKLTGLRNGCNSSSSSNILF